MPLGLDIIQHAADKLLEAQKGPDLLGQYQKMSALRTMALQQQDIQAQTQERQAQASRLQNAEATHAKIAQAIAESADANGNIDWEKASAKVMPLDQTIGQNLAIHAQGIRTSQSEADARKRTGDIAQDALDETKAKNLFEQMKERDAQARKDAEESAGTLLPGTEFSSPDAGGKPSRAAQFRVRQPDGSYKNETRILGQEAAPPQNPPQEQPPVSPGRFQQQKDLANLAAANRPQATVLIQTEDASGNKVQKIVPKAAGAEYAGAPTAQEVNRRDQADVINREADRIMKLIDDSPNAVGPILGRIAKGETKLGTVSPEAKALGTALGSFVALQPILHGFRGGNQTVEHFVDVLGDQHLNAAALKASIAQIKALATDIRQGRAQEEKAAGKVSVTAPDGSVHTFDTQAQADAFKKLAGIK